MVDAASTASALSFQLTRSRLLAPNKSATLPKLAPKGTSGNVWGIWYGTCSGFSCSMHLIRELTRSLCSYRHAAAHGNHLRVRELVEEKGVPVDARDRDGGRTSLHWACKNADIKLIKYLLGQGANVNAPDGVRDVVVGGKVGGA